ncbi:hypothetical protein MUK42_17054, partial [Musa troglodytarum]
SRFPLYLGFHRLLYRLSLVASRSTYVIDGGRWHGQLHRYPPGHHPPSTGCLPQVRMPGGVLDLPAVDVVRVPPGHHLCCVCHHQVNSFLLLQGFSHLVLEK